MKSTWPTASLLLTIIIAMMFLISLGLFFGIVVRGQLLPNLESIAGITTEEIRQSSPGLMKVIFIFVSVISGSIAALATGLALLVRGPFRRGDPETRRIIFISLGLFLLFAEVISLAAFPYSPWPLWSICIILGLIAFYRSRPKVTDAV